MINYFAILRLSFVRDNQMPRENCETVLEAAHLELFEKRKIVKIGQVVAILVHPEVFRFYSETEREPPCGATESAYIYALYFQKS